jgi:hypothetical protein
MQPIAHFLLSVIAGIGVGLHLEGKVKKYLIIMILALLTTAIDLDHLLPIYTQSGIKAFHNIFVFVLFPVFVFMVSAIYERNKLTTSYQRISILLAVMFVGHMCQDGMTGGLPLFYPMQEERFTVAAIGFTVDPVLFSFTSQQSLLLIWGGIIALANIVEKVIFNNVEGKVEEKELGKGYRKLNLKQPSAVGSSNVPFHFMAGSSILVDEKLTSNFEVDTFDPMLGFYEDEQIEEYIFAYVDNL